MKNGRTREKGGWMLRENEREREREEQIGQNNCQEEGEVKRWRARYNENDRAKEGGEGKKKKEKSN